MSETHDDRIQWMADRGWIEDPSFRGTLVGGKEGTPGGCFGKCCWIDGHKGHRPHSLWLRIDDGMAVVHGTGGEEMPWHKLQWWIQPPPEEPVRPPMKARTLWDCLENELENE